MDAKGKHAALTKFVNLGFRASEAKTHVRLLNHYGKLIYAWGDWNGLNNAGTTFYKARNKQILRAGLRMNGVPTKGYPRLKGFWIPAGAGRLRMRKDGSIVFNSPVQDERRIPLDAELLEKSLYDENQERAENQIRAMVLDVAREMGNVDIFTIQNGLGSEILKDMIAETPETFADKIVYMWNTYAEAGREFFRWAPQAIGRIVKNKASRQDVKDFINNLIKSRGGNRSMIKTFKRKIKEAAKKRKKK